jgi:hypothetical protein
MNLDAGAAKRYRARQDAVDVRASQGCPTRNAPGRYKKTAGGLMDMWRRRRSLRAESPRRHKHVASSPSSENI